MTCRERRTEVDEREREGCGFESERETFGVGRGTCDWQLAQLHTPLLSYPDLRSAPTNDET